MKPKPQELLITLPLNELREHLLRDIYGHPSDNCNISPLLAEIISLISQNKNDIHVQFPSDDDVDILDRPVTSPILWRYSRWSNSTEKWLKDKKRSEQERQARFIFQFNVERACKTVMRFTELDHPNAMKVALNLVNKNHEHKVIAMGGKPFAKTIEEIA